MSMVAGLRENPEGMWAYCPACGECIPVDDDDEYDVLPSGNKEYFTYCGACGQGFYVSKDYDEYG